MGRPRFLTAEAGRIRDRFAPVRVVAVPTAEVVLRSGVVVRVTDAVVSVEGESLRSVTWVHIEDMASGCWRVDERPVPTKILRGRAPAALAP